MPPVRTSRGRASKACEGCRRGKTRCYPGASGACLRCATLGATCSLREDEAGSSPPPESIGGNRDGTMHDCSLVSDRVAALERVVSRLTQAIGIHADASDDDHFPQQRDGSNPNAPGLSQEPPMLVVREAAAGVSDSTVNEEFEETIVAKGLISTEEATQLLKLFVKHYGRWIGLVEGDETPLNAWASPLLLCSCCLIAVRHFPGPTARRTAGALFREAKALLSRQLLKTPQTLPFFQAVLVLSLWSTTIGQTPLSIDGWTITGFAIQHGLVSDVFASLHPASSSLSLSQHDPTSLALWNHLCLSHLHSCISMGRVSMLRKLEIEHLTKVLSPRQLPNFGRRMVAELNLYWTLYETSLTGYFDLQRAQKALQTWKQTYYSLFDQPRSQFLEIGYNFAQVLVFERALNNKSAAVRESLVNEMARICSAILHLAMDTTDDRTRYLTDHVYHMITFAAVTLCRLLAKYNTQIHSRHPSNDLDSLVLRTARWLRSLGEETHIGHTMGRGIEAVHGKLRPENHADLQRDQEQTHSMPEWSIFPDLLGLGTDSLNFDWDIAVPDWQSLASDEAMPTSALPPG